MRLRRTTGVEEENGHETLGEIRNAISLGGDSDTIAAITGDIAQASYRVPDDIREDALSFLDEPLLEVVLAAEEQMREDHP